MHLILHDFGQHLIFAPLTLTRAVGNLRTGMWTNDERWQFYCPEAIISFKTETYLSGKFPLNQATDNYWVNAAVIPSQSLVIALKKLEKDTALYQDGTFIAYRGGAFQSNPKHKQEIENVLVLQHRWDLFKRNDTILQEDFFAYTLNRKSQPLAKTNTLIGNPSHLFIEEGAQVTCAILNVETGPIYIGDEAEIMENSVVRGGLAMAANSVLKMSAKIYGATSLGPHCKIGGEVNNVIFQGYSNKGHDGFIGNALIGEWCNLGADTNCSNLKNNYGKIKTYDFLTEEMIQTKEQFMGICMGDFSKTSINTMLNTATVIGVCANIFIQGFPPKYVPSFSWGGQVDAPVFELGKAYKTANAMMGRRGLKLSSEERDQLSYLFQNIQ